MGEKTDSGLWDCTRKSKNRRKECDYGRARCTGRALYGEDRRKSYRCNRDRSWTGQSVRQALYGSCIHS